MTVELSPQAPEEQPESTPEAATDSVVTREPLAPAASTGDPRVDAVTAGMSDLDDLPVGEHVDHYADMHSSLQEILNEAGNPSSTSD